MVSQKYIIFFILLVVISSFSCVSLAVNYGYVNSMSTQCKYTRYPSLCVQTLSGLESENQNVDFLSALVNKTISETNLPTSNFEKHSYHFISPQAQHVRTAIGYCHELMDMSLKRLNQAKEAIQKSPKKYKVDIQTWLSAALTFQQTCKDLLEDQVQSNVFIDEIYKKMNYLSELSSNQLAMANQIVGNPMEKRHLLENDNIFPRWISRKDRKLLQSTGNIKANAVVAKDGSGDFETISDAIQSAGGGRYVIYVKSGTYNEKINTNKDGITLIGDGKYSTIITGGSSVAKGSTLRGSATFTITGDGFIARDIGFQNTAGSSSEQALALTISSDHSVLYRCSISGYQDTLYALSLRQFYRECDIYGTIDFIFGNAAAVLQSCSLILRRPRGSGAYNVILASGRTDPGQNTGFSVQGCKITVGSDFSSVKSSYKSYLGRPWKEYSRAVVMESNIDDAIDSRGWVEWPGASGSIYRTLYFAEYGNTGSGAGTSGRVNWPGFHVIGQTEAYRFTVSNLIGGNSWLPGTGVTFTSGL